MSTTQIAVLVLSLEGLLFIALGFAMPGMAKSRIAGVRIRATLADERVWQETHQRAGPGFMRVGGVILGGGLALVVAPVPDAVRVAIFAGLAVGSFVVWMWDTTRYANARLRYWREVDQREATAH